MSVIQLISFSRYPFGRYEEDGPYSGEVFRKKILLPAFRKDNDIVEVILDGARGLGSSFLEEAFGGLVREGIPAADVHRRLKVVSNLDPSHVTEIKGYIDRAHEQPPKRKRAG